MSAGYPSENPFHHAAWRTYTPADGLPGLLVDHIDQDADGFLWFTTVHGGACRFDGEEFRTFTPQEGLPRGRVTCLLRDSRDRLWLAMQEGKSCWYDGREFHPFDEFEYSRGVVQCMMEDREGRIWFWGIGALGWYDGKQTCDLLSLYQDQFGDGQQLCWGMAQDAEGNVWLGGNRLVRYDGEAFHPCGTELGLPEQDLTYVVGADAEGEIWFAGDKQIMRYDGERFRPLPHEYRGGTRRIRHGRQGQLWFCTIRNGVYCLDGDRLFHVGTEDGLGGDAICDVFQDREGLLWFSHWGSGISCCDPHGIHHFGQEKHLQITELQQDVRGRIWMVGYDSAGSNIARLDRKDLIKWHDPNKNVWMALCEDHESNLWHGGDYGLVRWDEKSERSVDAGEVKQRPRVTTIVCDVQGRLVFSHDSARRDALCITRYDGHSFELLFQQEKDALFSWFAQILPVQDGSFWIALGGADGLVGDKAGLGRLEEDGRVVWYRCAEGLVDTRIEGLCEDREGCLWIATRGGISHFDGERFTNFTREEGLPVESLLCACCDRNGDLWFGAENGVVHYDGKRFQIVHSSHIYGRVRQILEDRDGGLWFATDRGIVCYRTAQVAPKMRVLRVIADVIYEGGDAVEVPVASGQVIFEFKGMSMRTTVGDLCYVYRLKGYDADWQAPTRERRIAYAALPSGDYTFEVKGIDRDLNESEPASVDLKVMPDERIQGLAEALGAGTSELVGRSPALRRVQAQLAQVAETDLTVLILGETGTGKGLVARSLHAMSTRRDGPLIQINCGALPEALVESELFGHEKGAFTGAHTHKLGKVELAAGGTLFLDEIGDMSREAQVKLLHLLEERHFERVGGTQTLQADVRVVAATNRDLESMVANNSFREDLFYRLQVFPVQLPPLRQLLEDVELLAVHFAERMAAHLHKPLVYIEEAAFAALRNYAWPGNVRELEHVVQRAVIICRDGRLRADDLALVSRSTQGDELQEWVSPEEYERRYMRRVLERCGWVLRGEKGAATQLGLAESTLRGRMKKLGIQRP
jgi:DNA-binding NtrC family response regulator/ligand-binding sensor domain-containing protein